MPGNIQPADYMKITVNGSPKEIADNATVRSFLDSLQLKPETVAVELNLGIVPKKEYETKRLKESDKIEIISFVGGG
jgi:thiamine biosynthesis protein ThiS